MSDTTISPAPNGAARRPPRRRLRRWLIGLGVALALLAVAAPLGLWGWAKYEGHALARRVEALRQAGEPMTPADLASTPVFDADNAAVHFRAAARAIDTKTDAWVAYDDFLEESRLPLRADEQSALRAVVTEKAGPMARAGRAAGKGRADWQLSFDSPMIQTSMPDLNEQRKLARLLRADGLVALDDGDASRALRRVDELLAQSQAVDHHPTLVGHLVAGSISAIAVELAGEAARELGAAAQTGSPAAPAVRGQVAGLIARLLDEREFRAGLIRAHQAERVMQLDAITAVANGGMPLNNVVGAAAGKRSVRTEGIMRALLLRNASAALDYMTGVIEAAAATDDAAAFRARRAGLTHAIDRSPRVYFLANLLVPSVERATRQHYRLVAGRRMAAAALAVALYRADHDGRLPDTLADLVPAYLPAVPGDPLAGGDTPLGYVRGPDRPRLYSVGDNAVDDGGRPPDPAGSSGQNQRTSDDVLDLARQPRPDPPDDDNEDEGDPASGADSGPGVDKDSG